MKIEEESSFSEEGSSTKIYQQLCTKKKLAKKLNNCDNAEVTASPMPEEMCNFQQLV